MLIGTASAIPGIPNQFYGSVTVDGSVAPDGTRVSAQIDGDVYATTTADGIYSLLVKDPDYDRGDGETTIEFFVIYVKVDEATFENSKVTELDLGFTTTCGDGVCTGSESCSSCSQDCGKCQKDTGGSHTGSSGSYMPPCYENWTCSAWSECRENGKQTRNCEDLNGCGTELEKPAEESTCAYSPAEEAPSICSAGTKICSGEKLLECSEGKHWNIIKTCEYGCNPDTLECKSASVTDTGEGSPTGGGLTGLFVQNLAGSVATAAFLLIIVAGLLVYWKKFR